MTPLSLTAPQGIQGTELLFRYYLVRVVSFSFTAPCTDGQLRLAGGNVNNEGRVDICLNNEWGTICDRSWNTNDAKVACGALGFSRGGENIFMLALLMPLSTKGHRASSILNLQVRWHLAMVVHTLALEVATFSYKMFIALGQSLLSWSVRVLLLPPAHIMTTLV